jgi:hypothetical protein
MTIGSCLNIAVVKETYLTLLQIHELWKNGNVEIS